MTNKLCLTNSPVVVPDTFYDYTMVATYEAPRMQPRRVNTHCSCCGGILPACNEDQVTCPYCDCRQDTFIYEK